MNVAIIQLVSYGDVLLSTCVTDAIKKHRPDWRITFVTSSICGDAIRNNPSIDEIKIIQVKNKQEAFDNWGHITDKIKSQFDRVIIPWAGILQPSDWRLINNHLGANNFMWAYPRMVQSLGMPYSGKIKTFLYPTPDEYSKVRSFLNSLDRVQHKMIMMEIAGDSGQTHWNITWTEAAIKLLISIYPKMHLFISHGGPEPQHLSELRKIYNKKKQHIHYMNNMSLREMSILYNDCDIMFSVSSGTANACMTHLCKKNIRWFELVNAAHWDSFPMWHDQNKFIFYKNQPDTYFAQVKRLLTY